MSRMLVHPHKRGENYYSRPRIYCKILIFVILSSLLSTSFIAVIFDSDYCDADDSHKCGKNLTWEFDNGSLRITGTGEMFDYNSTSSSTPWYDKVITSISLPDGLTRIGNNAFKDCYSLNMITIPDSVISPHRLRVCL